MSIPETLLAAVCLLVTCSGIAAMAEDWRDTASANRAAAEFTVTARRAAAWVLSRRTDLAEKAEHAPFSLTELCPETASARNSVTGQPYTAFLFTPETGQLSLALFAAGGSGDREMLRKIIRPAARRIEAGFFVAENGLLVRGNEKLSPASLCSGCGSLSSALPAGSWGTILTLPEGRAVSAVPADGLVSRLAVPGGEEARMDAALGMNGNAVTDLSALFFSGGNGGSASAGDAAFRESCASGSGEGTLTFFSGSGLLLCRGKEAVALPDSLSSPPSGLASRHQRQRLSPQTGFRGRNLSSQRHRRHRIRDLPPGNDPRCLVRRRPDPEKNLGQKKRRGSSRRAPGGIQRKRHAPARLPSSGGIKHAPFSVSVTASGFFPALSAPRRSRPEQPRKSAGPAL